MRWTIGVVLCLAPMLASAQESRLQADFRREGERVRGACDEFSFRLVTSCAYTFFTDHPLHIAAGSMPPQNGFGLGPAFAYDKNTTNWRMTWDADAVGATSGAWRAGGYMRLIHTPPQTTTGTKPKPGQKPTDKSKRKPRTDFDHPNTVINLYAQAISLNQVSFFGLGNNTNLAGETVFGMRETIVGASAIKPVFEWPAIRKLNLALLGEINGRFVSIRGQHGQSSPSIEARYNEATAPGLTSQPGFIQFGEGVRINPVLSDHIELNYLGNFQQFVAPSNSHFSFLRWTVDLNHTVYFYGYTRSGPRITSNGPNMCAPTGQDCPPAIPPKETTPTGGVSRNLNGSLSVRLLISESITSATSAVPFYFQPTLGGQNINSALALGSYRDYRFRAPNILLLQETFEHSIWGPFGVKVMADQGRLALIRGCLNFSHLRHSYAGGLTLRAGAFPMVSLMFAWGGKEGHHNILNVNTSMLGGWSRPPLD